MTSRDNRTILLIDNSAAILSSMSLLLKRLEYRVVTARSAEDALRIMSTTLPLVIITEVSLASMSGVDFIKQVKDSHQYKATPVIVLTSTKDRGVENACMRHGCGAYLIKPVEPAVLYRAIQAATESSPRMHIRLKTTLKIIVGDDSVMGGSRRTEQATAVSEGGLFVMTRYPQPRNAVTPIRMVLDNREVVAKAEVLYTYKQGEGPYEEPGMGMKFVKIADDDRAAIRDFIKRQLLTDVPRRDGHENSLVAEPR